MASQLKNLSNPDLHQYSDDEMLMLSGIQHFLFCPRQWALIHVEQLWKDNHLTLQGNLLHKKTDNPFIVDSRDGVLYLRSVAIASCSLGLSGIADMLELTPSPDEINAISFPQHCGYWNVTPVEYKHGRPKSDDSDSAQICAQAMCLEEMYHVHITNGEIFYASTRRRKKIVFTNELRTLVADIAKQMHDLVNTGTTPMASHSPKCKSCSLNELCMVEDLKRAPSANHYLKQLCWNDEETA